MEGKRTFDDEEQEEASNNLQDASIKTCDYHQVGKKRMKSRQQKFPVATEMFLINDDGKPICGKFSPCDMYLNCGLLFTLESIAEPGDCFPLYFNSNKTSSEYDLLATKTDCDSPPWSLRSIRCTEKNESSMRHISYSNTKDGCYGSCCDLCYDV